MDLTKLFADEGADEEAQVPVDVSYDIIRHVSAQLYTSPRKAIEELVCNAYDARASVCHVKLPIVANDALIVLDNGHSMDLDGIRGLWEVARSPKDRGPNKPRDEHDRLQIGKFGVGKLAAFALGERLTYVACIKNQVRLISVNQDGIKGKPSGGAPTFPVHKLALSKAKDVLNDLLGGPYSITPWRELHEHDSFDASLDGSSIEEYPFNPIAHIVRIQRSNVPTMSTTKRQDVATRQRTVSETERERQRKMTNRTDDPCVTLALRLKVRPESYAWLNAAALEVNQVWNFCNQRAATVLGNLGRWVSGFDLCYETAGSTQYMRRIGADTIQRVCTEYAAKRNAARKQRLRWRVSRGARRSLGWVPFKAASLKRRVGTCASRARRFACSRPSVWTA